MKPISAQILTKLAVCAVLIAGASISAVASCSDGMAALAKGRGIAIPSLAAALRMPSPVENAVAENSKDNFGNNSIVGLWHVQFFVGGQAIQEAFQIWNLGGTEVHNINQDPRLGTVCLGTWIESPHGTYKLAHRVWNYDSSGNFLGTIHLTEVVHLIKNGKEHTGPITFDFYDPSGSFQTEVTGSVIAQRIQVE